MRSLFEEQIDHQQRSLSYLLDTNPGEILSGAREFFPAYTDYPLTPNTYLDQIGHLKSSVKIPVIASLNGHRPGAWTDYAHKLEQAGADMVVVECIPAALAKELSESVQMPVIGIGAGVDCDGQVLVVYDMLGITPGKRPKFSKDFLAGKGSVAEAIQLFCWKMETVQFYLKMAIVKY